MRICLYLQTLFLLTVVNAAPATTIEGRITDNEGRPLPNATVSVEGSVRGSTSDSTGRYRIDDLPPGQYVLSARMIGYRTVRIPVTLRTDEFSRRVDISLEEYPVRLDEVVVTARKRSERIALVPVAITAVEHVRLDEYLIRARTELDGLAPNMLVGQTGSHLSDLINIRGMFPATPMNATTLTYFDGVPVYGYGLNPVNLSDVERIEILRGPQPIQYGRNAFAGVLHIINREPSAEPSLQFEAGYGSLQDSRVLMSGSLPLHSSLTLRGSGFRTARAGAFTNTTLQREAGGLESYGGSVRLRFAPAATFVLELVSHFERLDESIWPYATTPETALAHPYEFQADVDSRIRKSNLLTALKLRGRLGGLDLHANVTYQAVSDLDWYYDADFTGLDITSFREQGPSSTLTAELRVESIASDHDDLEWRAGMFVATDRNTDDYAAILGTVWTGGHGIPIAPLEQRTNGERSTTTLAIFAETSIPLGRDLQLSLGARAEREDLRVDTRTMFFHDGTAHPLPIPPFNSTVINDQQKVFTFVSPTAAVQYRLTEASTAFLRAARGVHGGGFNSGGTQRIPYFEPEYCWTYEVGYRATWLDRRVEFGSNLFYTDWRQQQILVISDLSNPLQTVDNAGRTSVLGLECDGRAVPFTGLTVTAHAGLLRARLEEYRFEEDSTVHDYSGNELPGAPRLSTRLSATYRFPIALRGVSLQGSIALDYRFTDPYAFSHRNVHWSSARHLIDAHAGVRGDTWEVFLWVRNVLDHRYVVSVYEFRGGAQALLGLPRTGGVGLRWRL